jgi:hypothetical protein
MTDTGRPYTYYAGDLCVRFVDVDVLLAEVEQAIPKRYRGRVQGARRLVRDLIRALDSRLPLPPTPSYNALIGQAS